jgi:DnaK suppressor protein
MTSAGLDSGAMDQAQRGRYRKALEKLRREALAKAPARVEPNRRDAAEVGVADEDAQALSEMLQAISSQRNKGQAERVARIDRALRRLADEPDEYGLCEECGEEIAPGRLSAMPEATLCAECQSARDPRRGGTRRKVTDYR